MIRRYEYQPESVAEALSTILVDDLRIMLKRLQRLLKNAPVSLQGKHPEPISYRKGDVIDWLQSVIADPDSARFVYAKMNSLEQSALGEAVHDPGGALNPTQIAAKYGSFPIMDGSGRGNPGTTSTKGKVVCPLLGIVLARHCFVAKDVQRAYQGFVPKPSSPDLEQASSLPDRIRMPSGESTRDYEVHYTEQSALLDVQTMLNLVAQGKVGVGAKTGRVSKAGARVIQEALSQGDFYGQDEEAPHQYDVQMGAAGIRPFAWPLLLQAGRMAQIEGSKLALTKSGQAALKKKPQELLKMLWERWLKTTILHEMNRVEVIKGQKSKKRPLYAARTGRENLKEALVDLQTEHWILLKDFFKHLFARGDALDIVRNDWALYIMDPVYGSFGYSHTDWDMLTGRFIRVFLLEYAATLGIIDVALVPPWDAVSDHRTLWGGDDLSCLSRYDGLLALRLTRLGAWILGQASKYVPARPAGFLEVSPELEIRVREPRKNPQVKTLLERFSLQAEDGLFRLDAGRALQAVEQGMAPAEMRNFLQDNSDQDLPGQVTAFFDQIKQRASLFRISGQATLVECSDPNVLQSVLEDPEMRKLCLQAGKSGLVVRKADEEAFRSSLHRLGYALPLG
ncbi:MAG: hypothetical protein K9K64_14685 [Desulfohalobiaceae bacterium]|nr:hypothetical protein [Desulfohalobiaceae bacterium]